MEIWNQPAYMAFRQAVLAYDFPYCPSCTMGPCDYVYAPQFTQDCYANDTPCGDCLWCTGLFQCLQ